MQNNLSETYSLLHYMLPHIFDESSAAVFSDCFQLNSAYKPNNSNKNKNNSSNIVGNNGNSNDTMKSNVAVKTEDSNTNNGTNPTTTTTTTTSGGMTIDRAALDAAHYMLRPFVLRRVKTEVEQKLPPKLETMIKCPLSDMQRFWIKGLLLKDGELVMNHFINNSTTNKNKNNENKNNSEDVSEGKE